MKARLPFLNSQFSIRNSQFQDSAITILLSASCVLLSAALYAQPSESVGAALARAAQSQVGVTTGYDPSYVRLAYPGGDVPPDRGVCTDVVIRAFRAIGVDLQVEIHQDLKRNFSRYPQMWGLQRPDRNIDHRRVPNQMSFFQRKGKALSRGASFHPGDIVAWRLPNGLYHIGIISNHRVPGTSRHFVVHNIGFGTRREDILHRFRILGHYRW